MVSNLLKNAGVKTLKTTVGVVKKGTKLVGSKQFKVLYGTWCVATTVVCTVGSVRLLKEIFAKKDESKQNEKDAACKKTNKKGK